MYYQQPCPHCGHRAGWEVEGRRVIITHYDTDGEILDVEHKPDEDADTGFAKCRVCGARLERKKIA